MFRQQQTAGTAVPQVYQDDTKEMEQSGAVSVLAEGGTVLSPLKPHPKPDDGGCGSLTKDRYGFTWIITCPNKAKQ